MYYSGILPYYYGNGISNQHVNMSNWFNSVFKCYDSIHGVFGVTMLDDYL